MNIIKPVLRTIGISSLLLPVLAISDDHYEFSIAVMPDTQTYTTKYPGLLRAQLDWIVSHQDEIAFVTQLGDLRNGTNSCASQAVNHFDYGVVNEWETINREFSKLDSSGIPYGVTPGNHDYEEIDTATNAPRCSDLADEGFTDTSITAAFAPLTGFESHFGLGEGPGSTDSPAYADPGFGNRLYYGDQALVNVIATPPYRGNRVVGSNRDNFILFESDGVKFISINLAYREDANPEDDFGIGVSGEQERLTNRSPELTWADGLLKRYPDRIGIVSSHFFLTCNLVADGRCAGDGRPLNNNGPYGSQVYDRLKGNSNLMMMLAGHESGEAYRREIRAGMQPVHIMLLNYQRQVFPLSPNEAIIGNTFTTVPDQGDGSAGFMRVMRFDVDTSTVDISTFAPPIPLEIPATDNAGGTAIATGKIRARCVPVLPNSTLTACDGVNLAVDLVSNYDVTASLPLTQTGNASFTGMHTKTASNFSLSFAGYVQPLPVGNLIVNGDFEDPDILPGTFAIFASIPGWIATRGEIEIQDNVAGSPFSGDQFVELDANGSSTIAQTVTGLTVGQQYQLAFMFSAREFTSIERDNRLQVSWGGIEVFNQLAATTNPTWTEHLVNLTATSSTMSLEFSDVSPDRNSLGVYIDDLRLVPIN